MDQTMPLRSYILPGIQLNSALELPSFSEFEATPQAGSRRMVELHSAAVLPFEAEAVRTIRHRQIDVTVLTDGWLFSLPRFPEIGVQLSGDRLYVVPPDAPWKQSTMLPLLRTALECASAQAGILSLHSACVEMDGQAVCFTAPSGTGKSTRAMQWVETLGARLVSGDRPSIRPDSAGATACGVPWDGKEGIYRNVRLPLKMICKIVRSDTVHARRLSKAEARQLLLQQCFIPMWDNEAAVAAMVMVRKLIDAVPIVELHCGPDAQAAREAYDLIYHHPEKIMEEAT